MLDTQYAEIFRPDMICMCFKLFSLSFRINVIIEAGISAKAIDMMKTRVMPLYYACFCLSCSVIGKDAVTVSNLKLGFPLAYLRMASYMNWGKKADTSWEVMLRKLATLNCMFVLSASYMK